MCVCVREKSAHFFSFIDVEIYLPLVFGETVSVIEPCSVLVCEDEIFTAVASVSGFLSEQVWSPSPDIG